MTISTRGRYALRVMVDLAENESDSYIPMKTVAERQNISLKYLEKILPTLTHHHLIVGVHGKGGGYKLTKSPEEYKIGDILRLTEGEFVPVACLGCSEAAHCENAKNCKTKPLWHQLQEVVNNYLDSVTLADLLKDDTLIRS